MLALVCFLDSRKIAILSHSHTIGNFCYVCWSREIDIHDDDDNDDGDGDDDLNISNSNYS